SPDADLNGGIHVPFSEAARQFEPESGNTQRRRPKNN
ncbi:MAG: hypothetical protein JWO52_3782, partial [Gammaproteobacteria bacterium]|nr:hypothetical protein [Gammaproteobacteria bacterium]